MSPKLLFVLAGYPSSGKSTLLNDSLANKVNIFSGHQDSFFGFNPTTNIQEWRQPFSDLLKNKNAIPGKYLSELNKFKKSTGNCLVHLDLLTCATTYEAWPSVDINIKCMFPRHITDLSNSKKNTFLFDSFLANEFFRGFDEVYINTLYTPYMEVCKRWNDRAVTQAITKNREYMFRGDDCGKKIYDSIHLSWAKAIVKNNYANNAVISKWVDQRFVICKMNHIDSDKF